jgi:uncharacterized phage protein gp47/JayE
VTAADDGGGAVEIISSNSDETSRIEITGGTANGELVFSTSAVSGSPFNALDATPGRDLETDAAFRLRREQLLTLAGAATVEAVISAILNVADVEAVRVFENVTLVTDGEGVPGKAFESVVQGGDDDDIAQAIFDNKPVGIQAFGNDVTKVITDSQSINHTIEFSRPTTIDIYLRADVTTDDNYPTDGDDQIKAVLVALGDGLLIGDDVIYERFQAEVFQVAGVVDVPTFFVDTSGPPTGTSNIVTTNRERAVFDTSRVTVNS